MYTIIDVKNMMWSGGLIYYSYPYIILILSLISSAGHYAFKLDQSIRKNNFKLSYFLRNKILFDLIIKFMFILGKVKWRLVIPRRVRKGIMIGPCRFRAPAVSRNRKKDPLK